MAEFLKDSQVLTAIEDLIDNADQYIWLISPYIKLHQRIKDRLKLKKDNPKLEIILVFGKNKSDASKSLNKDDFEFLKDFPNVTIGYEERLHAKYYASENISIISSMNLHEFSQNVNIEVGIKLQSKKSILDFSNDKIDGDAFSYFNDVIDNCIIIFDKKPIFKRNLLGGDGAYIHSEEITNSAEIFFTKKEFIGKKYYENKLKPIELNSQNAFCIRTGKSIPFNLKKPMTNEVFEIWARHKNENYKEKYCHYSGEESNGYTSYSKPILGKYYKEAKVKFRF